jgi:hypothetical protein
MHAIRSTRPALPAVAAAVCALLSAGGAWGQTTFPFAAPVVYETGFNAFPNSIDAGDLDEDGFVDLVLAGRNADGLMVVFYGAAGGGYDPPALIDVGGQSNWAAIGNFNDDDHLDIAVSMRQGLGRVLVFSGNGTRVFPAPAAYLVGRDPNLVRVADVDGDTDPDLVVYNWQTYDITILVNDGAGGFTLAQDIPANRTASGSSSPAWSELADVDGDLDLDIAAVSLSSHDVVHVIPNLGDGTFGPPVQHAVAGIGEDEELATLTAADFDGDLDIDLVTKAGGLNFADRLIVLANDGTGAFVTVNEIELGINNGGSPWDIVSADFDGDEHVDLAWVSHILSTQSVGLLRNEGTGIPTFATPEQVFLLGDFPRALVPTDLDGDDDIDLAIANLSGHNAAVLENLSGALDLAVPVGFRNESDLPAHVGPQRAVAVACGDPDAGDCFEAHPGPACDDEACCMAVCAALPFCCVAEWDESCVQAAFDTCEEPPACPAEGSCFEPHDGSGCDDQACCELICLVDPFCCGGPWDRMCADRALQLCDVPGCVLGDCPPGATVEQETTDCYARVNDGCNLSVPAFTPIACGETVCGTVWTGGSRDTDWYEITVGQTTQVTWTVSSDFPSELFVVTGTCDGTYTLAASAFGGNCQPEAIQVELDPGTYYLYVAPGTTRAPVNNGIGCFDSEGEFVNGGAYEGRYHATATCALTCPADFDGDGLVGVTDFLLLLAAWNTNPGGPPDLDGDGTVGITDFLLLLAAWGPC